jgi:hypothetical protein
LVQLIPLQPEIQRSAGAANFRSSSDVVEDSSHRFAQQ